MGCDFSLKLVLPITKMKVSLLDYFFFYILIVIRLLDEHVFCMRQYATPDVIPENVLEVYFAYTLIFTPGQCNPPIPSTFMPTIK